MCGGGTGTGTEASTEATCGAGKGRGDDSGAQLHREEDRQVAREDGGDAHELHQQQLTHAARALGERRREVLRGGDERGGDERGGQGLGQGWVRVGSG